MKKSILIAVFTAFSFASVAFAEVTVIANSGTQVAAADVRDVFLGAKQFAGATKLVPVDNSGLQEEFLAKALKMDTGKYSTSWAKKSFRDGLNPPPIKSGDSEVVEFVKRTPGAVGYVKGSPSGVTVIKKY